MAGVNKVILVGNLGNDPEVKYMPSGDAIANISVATMDKWKDKATGEQREATEWHRVVFFGKLAEIVGQYLKKGSAIYVEGKIKTEKYTDKKDGIERYATKIIADSMQMLGDAKGSRSEDQSAPPQQRTQQSAPRNQSGGQAARPAPNFEDMDNDIPF